VRDRPAAGRDRQGHQGSVGVGASLCSARVGSSPGRRGFSNMKKTRVLIRLCLFRFGVRRFERDVNALLEQGWKFTPYGFASVEPIGFFYLRLLCRATLEKEEPDLRHV
jgi:hypothetical protein